MMMIAFVVPKILLHPSPFSLSHLLLPLPPSCVDDLLASNVLKHYLYTSSKPSSRLKKKKKDVSLRFVLFCFFEGFCSSNGHLQMILLRGLSRLFFAKYSSSPQLPCTHIHNIKMWPKCQIEWPSNTFFPTQTNNTPSQKKEQTTTTDETHNTRPLELDPQAEKKNEEKDQTPKMGTKS